MAANLPPYSTFRTDSKQLMYPQATSHGNILTFTPPGLKHQLNVKFPDSRLAVCEKCKKNFKTRDMCRVRNTHTDAPWTMAYICVTIDDSCLDESGKYVEKPLTLRMVQWQPYAVRQPFDDKTPVCSSCKRANRTRGFCRDRHQHRLLPWCTVYVLLSALDEADPSTVVAGSSKFLGEGGDAGAGDNGGNGSTTGTPKSDTGTNGNSTGIGDNTKKEAASMASPPSETTGSDPNHETDDINDIAESRTFLAKVSSRGSSIHWLELADFEQSDIPAYDHVDPSAVNYAHMSSLMDPSHPYAQHFTNAQYAAAQQQHQNVLKSQQQYYFNIQRQQQPPQGQPRHLYADPSSPSSAQQHLQPASASNQHFSPMQPTADAHAATAASAARTVPPGASAGEAAAAQQQHRRTDDGTQQASAGQQSANYWPGYYPPSGYTAGGGVTEGVATGHDNAQQQFQQTLCQPPPVAAPHQYAPYQQQHSPTSESPTENHGVMNGSHHSEQQQQQRPHHDHHDTLVENDRHGAEEHAITPGLAVDSNVTAAAAASEAKRQRTSY